MIKLRKAIDAILRTSGVVATRIVEAFDLRDIHAYSGLIMFGYGLHMILPAAAWSLCGLMLFWLGVRR